jgi:hypothetical protein
LSNLAWRTIIESPPFPPQTLDTVSLYVLSRRKRMATMRRRRTERRTENLPHPRKAMDARKRSPKQAYRWSAASARTTKRWRMRRRPERRTASLPPAPPTSAAAARRHPRRQGQRKPQLKLRLRSPTPKAALAAVSKSTFQRISNKIIF